MVALFTTERHVKYYLRCLKTFLPSAYTSNDSNRMLLAYFSLSGLDVLDVLQAKTTPEERQSYINWLYHCQVPSGGFRGFPGTDFGAERRTVDNAVWDPANVPATFFALVNLLILGDDLSRVKRRGCLQWLPRLQRADGSFGEVLGPDARIEGDRDLRYCMCAAGIRYILRGSMSKGVEDVNDIDVPGFMSFIQACQAYDGGMAESPFREPHSGHTYCAVGSLDFLRRAGTDTQAVPMLSPGSEKFEMLLSWLASRQTGELGEGEDEDDEDDEDDETGTSVLDTQPTEDVTRSLEEQIIALPGLTALSTESIPCAGFNGRCNKFADTCYSFWNGATLMMLDRYSVIDDVRNRRYLLEKVQHLVGGFGKSVGDPPDLLHSYFGMVSLAFQGEEGLARVDPALVTTERVVQHLESLSWRS
ncbi:Terpenoid cyclases/protein prenyltransferase alpha-alpha toroid [Penicillium pulvis]|uniref:Terpenoid cyclases/protein prenyltransferase alpha-alpha toroid n=1 Tax=Penicillium pulvis TaxID=1562058 RepID=UPI00254797EF|nr:Terpenoid cyclases/protein prenyltransferase alpha-alpha toroid [Penicillium pulvis]KAJ5785693.1 Terpenoid cyclases/protein prenyltransferase alpha-alpha toroid [Penicillium pulvis]